jgi:predicted unusual protein kinase regulating ubiquinone biosynthesis (AarF/ABC1/UbiB family)
MAEGDGDNLPGRMRRYARVSTAMGGLAARLAGARYLGLPLDRTQHAADLKAALGGIKGPLMKVAQLLATIPEALPKEYAGELASLQANAPPMGWAFVRRRMASELGSDWQAKFKSFEHEAARAASLGQVHRAVALDGRALACKLQYPDMASAVEADLSQLKLVMSLYERYDRAITTDEIHAEIAERLREELDYKREAAHMRLYRLMHADEPDVAIPEPLAELSTNRLLTMTWLDGTPFLEAVKTAPAARRNDIARHMFRAWYVPFYYYGVIHGDPHLGNYTIRADSGVNLLDFGCVRIFPAPFVEGVIDLYHALDRDDPALAVKAYESWGFRNLSRDMIAALNRWANFLYAPLLDDRKRRIQETEGAYGRDVAEEVHRDIRRLGGVPPPREFVFMDRAAIGLGSVFMHLKAEINWHRLFHELIDDFDAAALAKRQRKALIAAGVPGWGDEPSKPRKRRAF